jgi:hypothetical protein
MGQAPAMILVFEMLWTGAFHAPGNSATIQAIAGAFPGQSVRVFADGSHLHELCSDRSLVEKPNVSFHSINLSPHYRFRPAIVCFRRMFREFVTIWTTLRHVPSGEPCLICLISASSTAIFAVSWLARLSRRTTAVQVGLHGNANDAFGWRPRNPITRYFDLKAAMTSSLFGNTRFLVLEESIRAGLAQRVPGMRARTDVLPLPVNMAEVASCEETTLSSPIRIGLVGQATEAKGITPFLQLADRFQRSHPGKVEFHLVGRSLPGEDIGRFASLAHPVSDRLLTRAAFIERLSRLHFVCLPLAEQYYSLSASGAAIDAVTWLKPMIASKLPIVTEWFDRFGDVGYLCDDLEDMAATIEQILSDMDSKRYQQQVGQLRKARASRMPDALIEQYRALVEAGFPQLVARFIGMKA